MKLSQFLLMYREHLRAVAYNYLKRKPYLSGNKRFENIHRNQRCFIIGSGPSVMGQDLTLLNGEIVMTQNHFHVHKDIKSIAPAYHVTIPKYQPPEFDKDWVEWYADMEKQLPHNCILFAGINAEKMLQENHLFDNRRFFIMPGLNPLFMGKAFIDITRKIMEIPTVLTECLTIALYMGFSEIYLIGFDMDQISRIKQPETIRFYKNSHITRNEAEQNVLDDGMSNGHIWYLWWHMWEQYILLRKYAVQHNQKIVNLAPAGLLDCYPRDNYERIISQIKGIKA